MIFIVTTEEKLSCCLKAGYIWQEGFSYFEDIPPWL